MELAQRHLVPVNAAETLKQKSKAGRKPWIPPDLEQVEALASSGLTYTQMADALGIHLHTLIRKRNQVEVFAEALRRGRAKGISAVANKLWEMALSGNVVAAIFFLKCQAGWRELQEIDHDINEIEEQAAERERQLQLMRAMTRDERRTIQEITKRAKERLKENPVAETS
jgi:hypothetical protein